MEHTAKSLLSSPNPQILELRILTHHAGDARFSFLKGRYKNTWQAIKRGDKPEKTGVEAPTPVSAGGLGGLMGGYESEDDTADEADPPPLPPSPPLPESSVVPDRADSETILGAVPLPPPSEDAEDERSGDRLDTNEPDEEAQARALRRDKARAWMAARRQEKMGQKEG